MAIAPGKLLPFRFVQRR